MRTIVAKMRRIEIITDHNKTHTLTSFKWPIPTGI